MVYFGLDVSFYVSIFSRWGGFATTSKHQRPLLDLCASRQLCNHVLLDLELEYLCSLQHIL